MRVGLVIYGPLDSRSGGYLYDSRLVWHLRAAGDQVEVVSLPERGYAGSLADNFSPGLRTRLRRLGVDVLVQDELNHPSLFLLNRYLRREAAFPIVSLVHHLRISERHPHLPMLVYRAFERAYLRSVDGFIFNSRTTRAVVEAQVRVERPSVVAVPGRDNMRLAVDQERIRRRALEDGPLRILFIGNLIARKGLHTLLAALGRLAARDWTLVVVGGLDGDPGYAHSQKAAAAGLGRGRVRFTGFVPPQSLSAHLLESHVLAGPSQYEGYGIAYLEALGAGLPVIASTAGAAHEFIRDGKNGFLVPPEDPGRLAAALGGFMEDRKRLAEMGQAARETFEAHPTWVESMAAARQFLVQMAEGNFES